MKEETFRISERGCIEWTGSVAGYGYGVLSFYKRNYYVHRLAYRLFIGKIPNHLMVCHRCDNPRCFNPEHLFLGTAKDNVQDMIKKGRAVRALKGTTISDPSLPFFEARPDKETDSYYCGCWGWD